MRRAVLRDEYGHQLEQIGLHNPPPPKTQPRQMGLIDDVIRGKGDYKTPPAVVERLRAEVARTAGSAELRKRYQDLGIDLVASNSTEEFAAFLKKHVEEFTRLARDAGLTAP